MANNDGSPQTTDKILVRTGSSSVWSWLDLYTLSAFNSPLMGNILFVNSNGNDLTAEEGRIDLPWQSIHKAVDYLRFNCLQGYTIIVMPGTYASENPWVFANSLTDSTYNNNNTTVRLLGDVKITNNHTGIILDGKDSSSDKLIVNIIADNNSAQTKVNTQTIIGTPNYADNIQIIADDPTVAIEIDLTISNISFICGGSNYDPNNVVGRVPANILYSGHITGKLTLENTSFKNLGGPNIMAYDMHVPINWESFNMYDYNIYGYDVYAPSTITDEDYVHPIWDVVSVMNNTYWEIRNDYIFPAWYFVGGPDKTSINPKFFIDTIKFYNSGIYAFASSNSHIVNAHIITDAEFGDAEFDMQICNAIFYSISDLYIWEHIEFDSTSSANLIVTGAVLTNQSITLGVNILSTLTPANEPNLLDISLIQN